MSDLDALPWITFPERLDRRLRLGPFPSGRDAVKFVAAAAVGAVVSLAIVPWAGLPIVAVGAVVALWRPDGEPLDERLAAVARWSARRSGREAPMTGTVAQTAGDGRALLVLPDGRSAAVVRAGGVPLAFLPPTELGQQFELYRQLLRSVDGGLILIATSVPIFAEAVLPVVAPLGEGERAACDGYRELVTLLARRRRVRRVYLVLAQRAGEPEESRRLETSISLLEARLADLGIRSERLHGHALTEAARRLGWTGGAPVG